MPTIRDVARLAGVSPTTVSHVLSNRRPVSDKTRRKVLQAIDETGYIPNAVAQGLVNRRTKVVGVDYPTTELVESNPSLVTMLFSAANNLRKYGYQLLFLSNPYEDTESFRTVIGSGFLDGLILMEVRRRDQRVEFLKTVKNTPFVLIGRCDKNDNLNFVDIDSTSGVREATLHLIEKGHRRIVFVGGHPTDLSQSHYALRGYLEALETRDIEYDASLIKNIPQQEQPAIGLLNELLERNVDFSAIICLSELVCITLLRELNKRGIQVPEDISLISFGNNQICNLSDPTLTAISLCPKEMASKAVNILVDRIENRAPEAAQSLIRPKLTVRSSTAMRQKL